MARSRRFLDRPLTALSRATEAHASLSGHTDSDPATGAGGEEPGLSSEPPRRRRTQKRQQDGRFTK